MIVRREFRVEPRVPSPDLDFEDKHLATKGYVGWRGVSVIDLDDDDIKEWPSNDIVLVSAPGAGYIVIPDGIPVIAADAQAGVYTGIHASAELKFRYASDDDLGIGSLEESDSKISDLLTNASEARRAFLSVGNLGDGGIPGAHNQAIVGRFDNQGAGDLGGGDPANFGKIWFPWRVIALA